MLSDNEKAVIALVDQAFNSLWFLGACALPANHDRMINEVYAETLGQVEVPTAISGPATALLGAYALFVLPRGVLFDEFSKALTGQKRLDWTDFTWAVPVDWAPDEDETNPDAQRSEHNVIGGIRNAIAHANIEVEFSVADSSEVIFHLWSQLNATQPQKRNVRVSAKDLIKFVMRFHNLFIHWHENGKAFV